MSFFNYAFNNFIDKDNLLFKVDKIIDWNEISDLLYKTLGKQELQPVTGRDPYNYLSLFKILLIQQWHNLSDAKVEEALRTRIDFMWFTQLGFATRDFMVPDETTICRFRNKVIKHKILDKLLQMINASLVLNNLKVKSSQGAILDATLIESSVNSKAIPNLIVEDRQENLIHNDANHNSNSMKVLKPNEQSDIELDKDAKWLKKGKRTVFGYKNFVVTDSTDGYIETVDTTPANVSEINHLETVLDKLNYTPQVLFADKGYAC